MLRSAPVAFITTKIGASLVVSCWKTHHIPSSALSPSLSPSLGHYARRLNQKRKEIFDTVTPIQELFTFSPFGLCCRQCKTNASIKMEERSLVEHVRKHGLDSRISTIRSLLAKYKALLENARALGTIHPFLSDDKIYIGFSCACGQTFYSRKDSALRHCTRSGCDSSKLQKVELFKLCCGRYVSEAQVTSFFNEAPRITQQFDYCQVKAVLLP